MPKFLNDTGLSHLISKIKTLLNGKVDKESGKALSTNDFTNTYKSRVDNCIGVDEADEVGINLWDEEWELGAISDTGEETSSTTTWRSINFSSIIPNASYFVKGSTNRIDICWYDANKIYISKNKSVQNIIRVSPQNASYFKLVSTTSVYNYDICVNRSNPAINGTYYPYRGLRKQITEVSNETLDIKMLGWSVPAHMGIKNTIKHGLFQQNVGRVKIKMLIWDTQAAGIFKAFLSERFYGSGNFNVTSNNYPTHTISHSTVSNIASLVAQYGDGIYINSGSGSIFIADSRYSTNTQFVNAHGDEYLYYELATKPAAINIDGNEATLPQGVDDASGLNLTSPVGTISAIHFVRIGRFVCVSLAITPSAAISVGTRLVSGFPTPANSFIPIRMIDSSNKAYADGYIDGSGRIYTRTELTASHDIYINTTYITE